MIRKAAVIFDMDGVLVDSEPIHKIADIRAFRTVGLDIPIEVLQEYAGLGGDLFFPSILHRYGVSADAEALRLEKNRILADLLEAHTPPVPGVHAMLDRLESLDWRRAVASSSDGGIVDLVLDRLNLRKRFDAIVTGSAVRHGKPSPDIFLHAASRVEVEPDRCVVIEDSRAGARAAKSAGMACIGLKNPLSGDQDLTTASRIVTSLDEIDAPLLLSLLHPEGREGPSPPENS
jgi:HAD superfamily hydrolase (TIGR01509 family)